MTKLSLRSRFLVRLGTVVWGHPRAWGLDCTPAEFYCMPSERRAANHNGSLTPLKAGEHASMARNLEVDLVRQRVLKHVALTSTAIAIAFLTATTVISFGYKKTAQFVQSAKASMQFRESLSNRKAELEKQAKTLKEKLESGAITNEEFTAQINNMQSEYKRISEELKR